MHKSIWLERWEKGLTGFHNDEVNPFFTKHFKELELPLSSRIFVPLCGKTLDIGWLLSKGFSVVGVELSEMAVKELFEALGEEPYIIQEGEHLHYHAENIDIFVGDFFTLTPQMIGNIDAVYDRAAIVALPEDMRIDYTGHMLNLAGNTPQLMTTVVYDQSLMNNSPFSVDKEELERHYGKHYTITQLDMMKVEGGLKQVKDVTEYVWLLSDASDEE
jgi:thiopurine S-methyltransferase